MSSQPFDEIPAKLRSGVGHPEMAGFGRELRDAHTESELEAVVERAIGAKGWMEFRFFDLGGVLRKELGAKGGERLGFQDPVAACGGRKMNFQSGLCAGL